MPIFAFLLNVGNTTHQPPPQERFGDWSVYVTTNEFLLSHLFASMGGAVFAVFGAMAFGVLFMQRGSVRLGLSGLLTGVTGNVLFTANLGVAAFVQPAIGRFYSAGYHDLAKGFFDDIVSQVPANVEPLMAVLLIVASFVIFGVAVAAELRHGGRPYLGATAALFTLAAAVAAALLTRQQSGGINAEVETAAASAATQSRARCGRSSAWAARFCSAPPASATRCTWQPIASKARRCSPCTVCKRRSRVAGLTRALLAFWYGQLPTRACNSAEPVSMPTGAKRRPLCKEWAPVRKRCTSQTRTNAQTRFSAGLPAPTAPPPIAAGGVSSPASAAPLVVVVGIESVGVNSQ